METIPKTLKWDKYLNDRLKENDFSKEYIKQTIEEYQKDGNKQNFLNSIRNVIKAQGGFTKLSQKTGLSRESLYKTLSKNGNPKIDTLFLIISTLGFKLTIK